MGKALLFLVVVALTVAVGLALLPSAEQRSTPSTAGREAEEEVAALPPEASSTPEMVPRASRDVTPPGVTPGPRVTGPLVRIPPPREPEPEPPPPEPRIERLFRPVVDSAGALTTAAGRIALAGIEAPAPDATCGGGGDGGEAWPCGRMARAELMRFIRGRAIECEVPPGTDGLPETTRCSVAGSDIGAWLVRQGWARPAGEAYQDAASEAEAEGRGLWGGRPR